MKQIWTSRVAQVAGKYGDHAPMAAVCCNACRTCVSTNLAGLAIAAVGSAGVGLATVGKRLVGRS